MGASCFIIILLLVIAAHAPGKVCAARRMKEHRGTIVWIQGPPEGRRTGAARAVQLSRRGNRHRRRHLQSTGRCAESGRSGPPKQRYAAGQAAVGHARKHCGRRLGRTDGRGALGGASEVIWCISNGFPLEMS